MLHYYKLLLISFCVFNLNLFAEPYYQFSDNWDIKLNGRIHFDHNAANQSFSTTKDDNNQAFRRLRLTATTEYKDNLRLKVDYDFVDANLTPRDLFIEFLSIPGLDSLKIGHVKEPIGLELSLTHI